MKRNTPPKQAAPTYQDVQYRRTRRTRPSTQIRALALGATSCYVEIFLFNHATIQVDNTAFNYYTLCY